MEMEELLTDSKFKQVVDSSETAPGTLCEINYLLNLWQNILLSVEFTPFVFGYQ